MLQSGVFNYVGIERVVFGATAAEVLASEIDRLGCQRVFFIASGSLHRKTDEVARLKAALGARFAGIFDRIPAHVPWDAALEAAAAARAANTDILVTVGGGSTTDAGKLIQVCLENNATTMDELDRLRMILHPDGRQEYPPMPAPKVRQISIPTTLSAGEFNPYGGATDPRIHHKQGFRHPLLVPRVIILDPALSLHTPEWLWLSTGVRAVDHAVEALCSPLGNAYCDGAFLQALRLLGPGLKRTAEDPTDLGARQSCQLGAWHSVNGIQARIPMGASHGIGHVLGSACGVPHGYTSCIMLPHVMRFNFDVTEAKQRMVAEALGQPDDEPAAVVAALIAALGMPTRLADVGVDAGQFDLIAQNCMANRNVLANSRKIDGPHDIKEILEQAA